MSFEGNVIAGDLSFLVESMQQMHGYSMMVPQTIRHQIHDLVNDHFVRKLSIRTSEEVMRQRRGIVRVRITASVEWQPSFDGETP